MPVSTLFAGRMEENVAEDKIVGRGSAPPGQADGLFPGENGAVVFVNAVFGQHAPDAGGGIDDAVAADNGAGVQDAVAANLHKVPQNRAELF